MTLPTCDRCHEPTAPLSVGSVVFHRTNGDPIVKKLCPACMGRAIDLAQPLVAPGAEGRPDVVLALSGDAPATIEAVMGADAPAE